jgi:hypothetical protein
MKDLNTLFEFLEAATGHPPTVSLADLQGLKGPKDQDVLAVMTYEKTTDHEGAAFEAWEIIENAGKNTSTNSPQLSSIAS